MRFSGIFRKVKPGAIRQYYSYAPEPFHPLRRSPITLTAEEAVKAVKSGDTIFVHSAAATPSRLLAALAQHGKQNKLEKITVCHIHIEGQLEYLKPEYSGKPFYKFFKDYLKQSSLIFLQVFFVTIPFLLVLMLEMQSTRVELILPQFSSLKYHFYLIGKSSIWMLL